jgi:hypothetical protein
MRALARKLLQTWWGPILAAVFTVALGSFLVAATFNRIYWGYLFQRPSIDPRALAATRLVGASPVSLHVGADGSRTLVEEDPHWGTHRFQAPGWYDADKAGPYGAEHDYYLLEFRLLHALELRGKVTYPVARIAEESLDGVFTAVTPVLRVKPSPGYTPLTERVRGIVYELADAQDNRTLLIALRTGEVSNDHYRFAEVLLTPDRRVLGCRRFFFDVAGMEGMEFAGIWTTLAILGSVTLVPVSMLYVAGRAIHRRRALRAGRCTRCLYDMAASPDVCPECGQPREVY